MGFGHLRVLLQTPICWKQKIVINGGFFRLYQNNEYYDPHAPVLIVYYSLYKKSILLGIFCLFSIRNIINVIEIITMRCQFILRRFGNIDNISCYTIQLIVKAHGPLVTINNFRICTLCDPHWCWLLHCIFCAWNVFVVLVNPCYIGLRAGQGAGRERWSNEGSSSYN